MSDTEPQSLFPLVLSGTQLSSEIENWTWKQFNLELVVSYYATDTIPTLSYVSSVRAIVLQGNNVLAVTNQDKTQHIIPGGRIEKNETLIDTLGREVSEETGWIIEQPRLLGLLHFRHLTPRPLDYPYPYPEFVQLVYTARAVTLIAANKVENDFEQTAQLISFEAALDLPISSGQKALLQWARKEM